MVQKEEKNGKTLVSFVVGSMPAEIYEAFTEGAKKGYGDCYWMKMKADMEKAALYDTLFDQHQAIWEKIEYLETRIVEIESKDQNALEAVKQSEPEERTGLGSKIPESDLKKGE